MKIIKENPEKEISIFKNIKKSNSFDRFAIHFNLSIAFTLFFEEVFTQ
jgi:hypothetical protein